MDAFNLIRPDDWHLHLRDDVMLARTVPDAAACFRRALVMPNLPVPVTTAKEMLAYQGRILIAAEAAGAHSFEPLMTLYLTDGTPPEEISRTVTAGGIAAKWYPAGVTTGAGGGVAHPAKLAPVLETMQEAGLVLSVHGEVNDPDIDVFDREKIFIEKHLVPVTADFPSLKIVLEHISTKEAADFVREMPDTVAATITAHHLLYNRNALLADGLRPHYYCKPVLKREEHRQALLRAATSGSPKFFLGTDSAPHLKGEKEAACGCAGCYTSPFAMALYAEAFAEADALARLEGFASFYGADFYGQPRNQDTLRLERRSWQIPKQLDGGGETLIPLGAGEELQWQLMTPTP